MFKRLGWILASYFTRPLILVLCGTGFVLGGLIWMRGKPPASVEINYPQMPRPELWVDSAESLERVRREGRRAEVDSINFNYLWADMQRTRLKVVPSPQPQEIRAFKALDEDFFRIVDEFPNLRSVQLTLYGNLTGAQQIARLPKLEYLSVGGVVFGDTVDIRWLGDAKKLKYLELSFFHPLAGLQELKKLPHLETLVFRSRLEVTDDVLKQAADLPHLKTLVFAFNQSAVAQDSLSEPGFAALAASKSLEKLYVGGWMPEDQTALVAMARRGAGKLKVAPSMVTRDSPFTFFVLYPAGILAAAIGVGLSASFRGPMSRLAPHFVARHAAVAVGMAASIVVLAAWWVTALSHSPLAAMIVAVAVVSTTCCMTSGGVIEVQMAQRQRQRKWIVWLKQALCFFLLGSLAFPSISPAILRGELPWMLAALGLVSVTSIVLTAITLRGLVQAPEIATLAPREGARARMFWQTQYRPGWMFSTSGSENRIEHWAQRGTQWTWWRRIVRWRAGNPPFRSERFLLLMLALVLTMLWVMRLTIFSSNSKLGSFEVVRGQFLFVAPLMLLAVSTRVATAWRARMLTLPLECLRPYDRRGMQNEMAAALVADLAPAAVLLAALEAVAVNLGSAWHIAWERVPGDFLLLAACLVPLVAGLAAVIVVVKRDWLVVALVLTVPALVAFAVALLTVLRFDNPTQWMRQWTPRAFLMQLWAPALVGAGLAWWMYRRWLTMEIGSRG